MSDVDAAVALTPQSQSWSICGRDPQRLTQRDFLFHVEMDFITLRFVNVGKDSVPVAVTNIKSAEPELRKDEHCNS